MQQTDFNLEVKQTQSMNQNSLEHPRLVLGLPVYNGEDYLRVALDSILNQTFTDFNLIIGDNASTDNTAAICQEYANRDQRVFYYRHEKNLGCGGNHNFVFQPNGAEYFKWVAHDDVLDPDYLRQCIEVLDQHPEVVIVHSRSKVIDERGHQVGTYDDQLRLKSESIRDRFRRILWAGYFSEFFGVMRSSHIAKTNMHGNYAGSDRNFLAEMVLQGDVDYVEAYLFQRRDHDKCFCRSQTDKIARLKWYDPNVKRAGLMASTTGLLKWKLYLKAIFGYSMPLSERLGCLSALSEWAWHRGVESLKGTGEQFRSQVVSQYHLLDQQQV